jgi:hypothetical protein
MPAAGRQTPVPVAPAGPAVREPDLPPAAFDLGDPDDYGDEYRDEEPARGRGGARAAAGGGADGGGGGGGGRGLSAVPPSLAVGASVILVVLVVLGIFLATSGGSKGHSTAASSTSPGKYNASLRAAYLDQCVRVSEGKSAYCACTLDTLEASYSEAQFVTFNENATSAESRQIVQNISHKCAGSK